MIVSASILALNFSMLVKIEVVLEQAVLAIRSVQWHLAIWIRNKIPEILWKSHFLDEGYWRDANPEHDEGKLEDPLVYSEKSLWSQNELSWSIFCVHRHFTVVKSSNVTSWKLFHWTNKPKVPSQPVLSPYARAPALLPTIRSLNRKSYQHNNFLMQMVNKQRVLISLPGKMALRKGFRVDKFDPFSRNRRKNT